ncbi:MAG: hypothetical protein NC086_00395 [Alistipes sp.]|nr:hypothetical protein [Alistipes sp.]
MDKEYFLKKYNLDDEFKNTSLSWNVFDEIYVDYKDNHYENVVKQTEELVGKFYEVLNQVDEKERVKVDTIFGRAKNPEHLIEKIIRKIALENKERYSKISKQSYLSVVTDVIGIRILVLAKEDWKIADDIIRTIFQGSIKEAKAYVCYGDRKIFNENLLTPDYTNRGYRSQHYVTDWKQYYAEIQVRTLAEEVHGNLEHRVRYPYRVDNKFLKRYGKVISQNVSQLDALISTCVCLNDKTLDVLNQQFKDDEYVDWSQNHKTSETVHIEEKEKRKENLDARLVAKEILEKR